MAIGKVVPLQRLPVAELRHGIRLMLPQGIHRIVPEHMELLFGEFGGVVNAAGQGEGFVVGLGRDMEYEARRLPVDEAVVGVEPCFNLGLAFAVPAEFAQGWAVLMRKVEGRTRSIVARTNSERDVHEAIGNFTCEKANMVQVGFHNLGNVAMQFKIRGRGSVGIRNNRLHRREGHYGGGFESFEPLGFTGHQHHGGLIVPMQVFDKGSLHGFRGYGFYPFMANKSPLPIAVQFGIDDRVVQLGPVHEHIVVLRELFVASGFQRGGRDALGFVMLDTRDNGLDFGCHICLWLGRCDEYRHATIQLVVVILLEVDERWRLFNAILVQQPMRRVGDRVQGHLQGHGLLGEHKRSTPR